MAGQRLIAGDQSYNQALDLFIFFCLLNDVMKILEFAIERISTSVLGYYHLWAYLDATAKRILGGRATHRILTTSAVEKYLSEVRNLENSGLVSPYHRHVLASESMIIHYDYEYECQGSKFSVPFQLNFGEQQPSARGAYFISTGR